MTMFANFLALVSALSIGQTAEVRFQDGSLVRVTMDQPAVEVQTRYGKLTVPIAEIRRVELGLHWPPGRREQLERAIEALASNAYKEREQATRELLDAGPLAWPLLKQAKSTDPEALQRVASLMKRLEAKYPQELLQRRESDLVHTAEFPIVGRIAAPAFKATSAHFGELSLKLSDMRTLTFRGPDQTELTIDAAKHGSAPDQWLDTGINLDVDVRLLINADGQVDLWPQGSGQYMATPKGYTTAGKGSTFMAGALVGRVGEHGKQFLIGERYDGAPGEEGRLYLHIVPSPWNNASTGSYRARISTSFK
jgi:hypothetical protein